MDHTTDFIQKCIQLFCRNTQDHICIAGIIIGTSIGTVGRAEGFLKAAVFLQSGTNGDNGVVKLFRLCIHGNGSNDLLCERLLITALNRVVFLGQLYVTVAVVTIGFRHGGCHSTAVVIALVACTARSENKAED